MQEGTLSFNRFLSGTQVFFEGQKIRVTKTRHMTKGMLIPMVPPLSVVVESHNHQGIKKGGLVPGFWHNSSHIRQVWGTEKSVVVETINGSLFEVVVAK